jgi:peroxiredoxin
VLKFRLTIKAGDLHMKKLTALFFTLTLIFTSSANAIESGIAAPDFNTKDIDGKTQSISQYKGKIVVLEWNNPNCPFVKKFYEPGKMQELQKQAKADGIVWLTINSSANGKEGNLTAKEAKENFKAKNLASSAYILDAEGKIGKAYGAASTPTVVIIDKEGKVAYFGAVDDKPSAKSEDIATAKNYITEVTEALKAGKEVTTASTKSYGCGVKYAN